MFGVGIIDVNNSSLGDFYSSKSQSQLSVSGLTIFITDEFLLCFHDIVCLEIHHENMYSLKLQLLHIVKLQYFKESI